MAAVIKLDVVGIEPVIAYFEQLQTRLDSDHSDVMTKAVKAIGTLWYENFVSEGSAVGGWAALSEHTLKERASQGYGDGPILRRQGSLESAVQFFSYGAPGTFSSTDRHGVTTEGSVSLASDNAVMGMTGVKTVHQDGNSHIPARPYWFVNDAVDSAVQTVFVDWLSNEVF